VNSEPPALIQVRVRYHNLLRHRAGTDQEVLPLDQGTSLVQALMLLAERHAPMLQDVLLTAEGKISPQIVVFCNGQLVGLAPPGPLLQDGDEIKLFPKISGGS
jgi:molybdopterin converting factor small subunit